MHRSLVRPGAHEAFPDPTTRHRVEQRRDSRALELQHSIHDRLAQANVVLASLEKPNAFFGIDFEKTAEASREIDGVGP